MSKDSTPPQLTCQRARLFTLVAAVLLFVSLLSEAHHVSAYLYPQASAVCSTGEHFDCAAVALSPAALFAGLPLAIWGVIGALAALLSGIFRSSLRLWLSGLGLIVSLVLLGVSLFSLGTLCLLCELLHLLWLILFAIAWRLPRARPSLSEFASVGLWPLSLLVSLWLFLPRYYAAFDYRQSPPYPVSKTQDGNWALGSLSPEHTLEEVSDYACPHCQVSSRASLRLLAKHPKLQLIRRHNPRMRCDAEGSCFYLRLAICAGDDFWRADRYLFETLRRKRSVSVEEFTRDLQLDGESTQDCLNSAQTRAFAQESVAWLRARKVRETPAYFLDGKRMSFAEVKETLGAF